MGKRVTLHYEEKVGLPTSCFGETRHFVNGVVQVEEIPLTPGIVVPTPRPSPDTAAPGSKAAPPPAPAPAPSPAPTPAPAPDIPAPPSTPPLQGY
jgi:hypothetical protein